MKTKTVRVGDDLIAAVHEVGSAERIEESQAMRKLMRMGYEMYLTEQYRAGTITVRHVALGMKRPLGDTLDLMRRLGVSGNTGADDTLASMRSLSSDVE
jgi:phosphoribosyl-dephospho-CoA transferase